MALRQMGIARMGPFRPKYDLTPGGKVGRPKLLHNGTGHGLTGGGGLNAKGTGGGIKVSQNMKPMQRQLRKSKYQSNKFNAMKINERDKNRAKRAELKTKTVGGTPMNPHPVGNFMYGNNQWGSINNGGLVDWTSTKPRAGRPTIGFQQALPWLQRTPHMKTVAQQFLAKRQAPPAWYIDPIYAANKAQVSLGYNNAVDADRHGRAQLGFDYTNSLEDLTKDYEGSEQEASASAANNNIAGSGIAAQALSELAEAFMTAKNRNQRQMELTTNEMDTGLTNATAEKNITMTSEQSKAKERWRSTHQGQTAPATKANTTWKEGGIQYRANAKGIPMTANQKPKFKSFKSFKDAHGNVVKTKAKGKK